jgi:hypothetical protein
MLHTRQVLYKQTGNCLFCTGTTLSGEWNKTEVLRDGVAIYYHVTVYHGHLIMPTNNQIKVLSQ